MKKTLTFCLAFMSLGLLAQSHYLMIDYDWDIDPTHTLIPEKWQDEDVVVTAVGKLVEYTYGSRGGLEEYNLFHKRLLLNSDEAVERNNRVYIPTYEENSYVVAKARIIFPDGRIKLQDEDNILEGEDEESGNTYSYFAFEGLEKGAEIEFLYIIQKNPYYAGTMWTVQDDAPTLNAHFELISPSNLVFEIGTMNHIPAVEVDTNTVSENRVVWHMDTLEALKREVSAFHEPNLGRIVYKLDANTYSGKEDILSYGYIAQNMVENYLGTLERKEEKAVAKMAKEVRDFEGKTLYHKMDNYLKTEYTSIEAGGVEELAQIDKIFKNKVMNERGAVRLYRALYDALDLDYTLLYTTNRSTMSFYTDFESYLSIRQPLFYLPELDDYVDPVDAFSRIGYINPNYRFNNALFLETVKLQDFVSTVAEIREVPELPGSFSTDSLEVVVKFGSTPEEAEIEVYRAFTGYNARALQPVSQYISGEDLEEFKEDQMKWIDEEVKVNSIEFENFEANLLGVKPMRMRGNISLDKLIERAGPKYLFKIGMLIGPQMELYAKADDEPRKLDVEVPNGRSYERVMRFSVPEGYTVSNLEALNINKEYTTVPGNPIRFVSSYVQEGNEVVVTIKEYYEKCTYPLEHFEEYRDIINAAADFNKVVLVLEKKA